MMISVPRRVRRVIASTLAVLSMCFAWTARAEVPTSLTQQGRLFDSMTDEPVEGIREVRFALYDAEVSDVPLWEEVHDVSFERGWFSAQLGSIQPFGAEVFSGETRYLGVTVGEDDEMLPRALVASVPYALVCHDAVGDIHPRSISIPGVGMVIDEYGNWVGEPTGLVGPKGDQGEKGDQGDPGIQGLKGDQGDQGDQGLKGDTGPQGSQGVKGDAGLQGPQGLVGPVGAMGMQGLKGDTGDTGAQGSQGPQGVKGDTGPAGTTGPQGVKGAVGSTGPAGATGLQGVKGDAGPQGIQGLKGDSGAQGPAGPSGPMYGCVLRKTCTGSGMVDRGLSGIILSTADKAQCDNIGTLGGIFNVNWVWCHPRLCCTN